MNSTTTAVPAKRDAFQNALDRFAAYCRLEEGLSELTRTAYLADLSRYIDFLREKELAGFSNIDYPLLESYMIYLADNLSLNPYTLARNLSSLRRFHEFLSAFGIAEGNPAARLDPPALRRKLPDALSESEAARLMEAFDGDEPLALRNRAVLEVLYGCGLRASELAGLPVGGLDFGESIVRVRGKRDKERLVPAGSRALVAVRTYLNQARPALLNGKPDPGVMFLNRRGGGLSRVAVFNIVKEAAQRAGLTKNVSPHTLRHSFATHLVGRGADLVAVKTMLGHESVATTEIYLRVSAENLRRAVAAHPRR